MNWNHKLSEKTFGKRQTQPHMKREIATKSKYTSHGKKRQPDFHKDGGK